MSTSSCERCLPTGGKKCRVFVAKLLGPYLREMSLSRGSIEFHCWAGKGGLVLDLSLREGYKGSRLCFMEIQLSFHVNSTIM